MSCQLEMSAKDVVVDDDEDDEDADDDDEDDRRRIEANRENVTMD
jgi:hypothetical protein